MKPREEEIAKECFERFLMGLSLDSASQWIPVKRSEEPPDYYLILGGQRYAVEVTIVVETIPLEPHPQPRFAIDSGIDRLTEELTGRAKQLGILTGTYGVWGSPIDEFYALKSQLMEAILDYVAKTQHMEKANEEVLLRDREAFWGVQKLGRGEDLIAGGLGYPAKWDVESRAELKDLIAQSLETKAHKLRAIAEPWVLILIDGFHYTGMEAWREAVKASRRRQDFHTVFAVDDSRKGHILYSKDTHWL